jgi:methylamine--corrinoid protein Co-methyltransferase
MRNRTRSELLAREVSAMVQILDVMEKALTGLPLSENDYQLRRFAPKVQEKVREFEIRYDPETPVPNDSSLADDLFEAGLELLVDVGAYCMDSGRVISFTESEVRAALRNAPDRLEMGEGKDRKTFTPRKIGDRTKPWCLLALVAVRSLVMRRSHSLWKGILRYPR